MATCRPAGSYGIDAPAVPRLWVGLAAASAAAGAALAARVRRPWAQPLGTLLLLGALGNAAGAAVHLHTSVRGKFQLWSDLLDDGAPAPARVLDIGCGRGAVAIMTARRFPGAHVTGVDLWHTADQSGNSPDAAARNASAAAVTDRVRYVTADMRELPFSDASFELVTASLSIHNLPSPADRRRAVREVVRVLAPGGRVAIMDIQHTSEYADALREAGLDVEGPRDAGWRGWWTGPWMPTQVLRARA
ncbi:Methyltransferase domain-containing protein [Quadrisphaera granulorum]|uniref:Methyltransferase family protein n=2 Tax=Quadrisphaera granulorum TaxID=317664 RepID=A0A316A931_9ACTN|nr:methyltransferase family protein [Quadrisphaera granulorum]SZE96842.1 Methyltransferase domain-containing protein [Quadrisphaera granulorum]